MEAGRRVFARDGYLNAEINDITREAGKSNGVFYNYFENKADLLVKLINEFKSDLHGKAIPSPVNAPENARQIVAALWSTYKAHASTFLAITDAAAFDARFMQEQQVLRAYARADYANMIRARQSQGYCRNLDPVFTAMTLDNMVSYSLYEWLARGDGAFEGAEQERKAFETLAGVMDAVLQVEPRPARAESEA